MISAMAADFSRAILSPSISGRWEIKIFVGADVAFSVVEMQYCGAGPDGPPQVMVFA
jgi:hypothetical protein